MDYNISIVDTITILWRIIRELLVLFGFCTAETLFHPIRIDESAAEKQQTRRSSREFEPQMLSSITEINLFKLDLVQETWAQELLGCDPKLLVNSPKPFRGSRILEIGCGVGHFAEALFELGAEVTGYDTNERLIQTAKSRTSEVYGIGGPEFVCIPFHELVTSKSGDYDIVITNSEAFSRFTIPVPKFVEGSCSLVRNEGCVIFGAVEKSFSGITQSIIIPELVLKWTLANSHHADGFISWKALDRLVTKFGFGRANMIGMKIDSGSALPVCEKSDQTSGFYFYVGKKLVNDLWPTK